MKPVHHSLRGAALLTALLGAPACDAFLLEYDEGITTETWTVSADSRGIAEVLFDVPDNADSLMITARGSSLLSVDSLYDSWDDTMLYWEDWYGSDRSLTYAIYPESDDVVLNWPVRKQDGPLEGGTWSLYLGSFEEVDGYYEAVGNVDMEITSQIKVDDSLSDGLIEVLVVYAEGVGEDPDITEATEQAVERWNEVWAPYGLAVEVSYSDAGDIDSSLAFPGEGSSLSTASGMASDTEVVVVVGEDIDGTAEYYGVAGSVPGTLIETSRAGVVVSWLANAGGDGSFSNADIRLYGETLAHEVGHYTGLFHPVETTYDMWDALGDTDDCGGQDSCEDVLGANNMFPYPLCNISSCDPQDELTDAQVASNIALVRYLKASFPDITHLIGHYEYRAFEHAGHDYFQEHDTKRRTRKVDPGEDFMAAVREGVADIGLLGPPESVEEP